MVSQREAITNLLVSTERQGINNVLQYLDDSGFFYRASSPHGHHNYPGGLAEHSLGTYRLAQSSGIGLNRNSIIICSLLHDICKSDRFWFKGRSIRQHTPNCEMDSRHSVRSIAILKDCGLPLSEPERRAIRWHMKGPHSHPRNEKDKADHAKLMQPPIREDSSKKTNIRFLITCATMGLPLSRFQMLSRLCAKDEYVCENN